MGAQRAAWQASYQAEGASLHKCSYAQSLLDLVKAFEKLPRCVLVGVARKHGYSLVVLRLTLAAYRIARSVGVEGVYSSLLVA
eukprot:4089448-Lingulodinium_polyedra.AAC.1